MRRYLVAGNWKLNLGPAAGANLAAALQARLAGRALKGDVLVCPPYVTIPAVAAFAQGAPLLVGAQDCSDQDQGAYTGQVSAAMLKEAGCTHVIVAHSERRQYQRETDALFVAKIDRVHAAGLTAIFCYGELLAERRAGRAEDVVEAQLRGVLPRLAHADRGNLVLAYEPVWAIGTGETATPEIAQQMHRTSRAIVADLLGAETARQLRILYGGSCKAANAAELFALPDVDGGLIGGASLKVDDFAGIIDAAERVK
ncbi:MAG TPA: triose-phosphate isomerase [Candidatus Krumholzibacteria bacterium]|nr:triose-phosphate isomerase [Candidatus Krumholzibacteria bacterium]HPD71883.1 triose-phosphate isomerase [Candidatus Krumholzibacteria bacterium]HRY41184.1 triose-phosphate isomerase [Candidatus Krumholzibacteria bacterium]